MRALVLMFIAISCNAGAVCNKMSGSDRYPGNIDYCYDADSCTSSVRLGFSVVLVGQKFRLYGIDAPELRGQTAEAGEKARDALVAKLAESNNAVEFVLYGKGKYGRWLVTLCSRGQDVNRWMVKQDYTKIYK